MLQRRTTDSHQLCVRLLLLLDVGTQFENVFLAGRLKLVGETEIFDLNLRTEIRQLFTANKLSGSFQSKQISEELEVRANEIFCVSVELKYHNILCSVCSPAGSVSLPPHTSRSSPSGVCSEPNTPSDHRCRSDYQLPPDRRTNHLYQHHIIHEKRT